MALVHGRLSLLNVESWVKILAAKNIIDLYLDPPSLREADTLLLS